MKYFKFCSALVSCYQRMPVSLFQVLNVMAVEILTRNWYFKTVTAISAELLVNSTSVSGLYIMFLLKWKMHQIIYFLKSVRELNCPLRDSNVKQLEKYLAENSIPQKNSISQNKRQGSGNWLCTSA